MIEREHTFGYEKQSCPFLLYKMWAVSFVWLHYLIESTSSTIDSMMSNKDFQSQKLAF